MPVDFVGDETIVGGVFPFWPIRFPDRQREVESTPVDEVAIVFLTSDEDPAQLPLPVERVRTAGVSATSCCICRSPPPTRADLAGSDRMWNGRTLAVVLPTYNEAESIAACVKGFEALGIVDDIVVVNNNAHPDTSPGDRRHVGPRGVRADPGLRRRRSAAGCVETRDSDLVCICEPDGTFDPDDIVKLLPFTADVDVVFGSRTVQTFILSGANMGWFLRWGNWAVAKLTEVLFNTVYLSDVGCTFRVLTRAAVDEIEPSLRVDRLVVRVRDDADRRRAAAADGAGAGEVPGAGGGELGHRRPRQGGHTRARDDPHVRRAAGCAVAAETVVPDPRRRQGRRHSQVAKW